MNNAERCLKRTGTAPFVDERVYIVLKKMIIRAFFISLRCSYLLFEPYHLLMKKFCLSIVAFLWVITAFAVGPSGSLPILYINTTGSVPIISKDYYLTGTYYLDALGVEGYKSIGTAESPLPLQIKGRGNWTWTGFDKKPYRLKLESKQPLMGMKKSKHFGLLAHADDDMAFLRNAVGLELSRRIGMEWTPEQQPVEVVLNGDYKGLYFLIELIRVDVDRVNVVEQADEETAPENITGGWLVEIDNYDDPYQIKINENKGEGEVMRFTHKSPEVLSAEQKEYLTNLVTKVDAAIYAEDKTSTEWQDLIDIDELAKFYIVQELTDNGESFHGSCYWHKEQGADAKLKFGPVWDFGNTLWRESDRFIYDKPPFHQHWIGEIAKFPAFQEAVKAQWKLFMPKYASLDDFIDEYVAKITSAAKADYQRWPTYGNADMNKAKGNFLNKFHAKAEWLNSQWNGSGEPLPSELHLYMVGASSVLGNWQPVDAPKFNHNKDNDVYSLHFDYIDKLDYGFKIIDRRTWAGAFEMCGNGSSLKLNEDYVPSTTVGDPNITVDDVKVENVDVVVRKVDEQWIIRLVDAAGVPDYVATVNELAVAGGHETIIITSTQKVRVAILTLGGALVASPEVDGTTRVSVAPGFYIVRSGTTSRKVAVW